MERPMSMMQWWKNIRCPSLSWEDHSVVIILGQTQSSKSRVAICNNCLIEGKIRLSNLGEAQDPPKLDLASPCARKALRWQGIWHAHRCWLLLSWEGAELLKILEWDSARRHGPAKYCTCPKSGHNCSAQFARLRVFFLHYVSHFLSSLEAFQARHVLVKDLAKAAQVPVVWCGIRGYPRVLFLILHCFQPASGPCRPCACL